MYLLDEIVGEWGHALGPVTFTIRPAIKGAEKLWAHPLHCLLRVILSWREQGCLVCLASFRQES